MNKYFLYLSILFQFSTTLAAQVYHSNNSLIYAPDYQYHIAGTVKDNTIIWKTFANRHSQSQIFVYDNSMRLVRKVNTNILQSDINPCLQFFATGNSFLVFYPKKHQSSFLYKFSRFDERGNLITTETLDSLAVKASNISNETFFYKILKSENNKVICFIKANADLENRVLKFDCSFIDDSITIKKDFVIEFDERQETLADIIADNNKNILLLKGIRKGNQVNLKLIKKMFSNAQVLIAEKNISTYSFEENSLHVAEKKNGYLVFGKLGDIYDTGYLRQSGLYVWQTNEYLKDRPRADIINKKPSGNTISFTANSSIKDKPETVFVTWNIFNAAEGHNAYRWYDTHEQFASYKFVYPALKEYPLYYVGYTTNTNIYLPPPYNKIEDDYAKMPDTVNVNFLKGPAINKLELFELSNDNKITWLHGFQDTIDNITTANLSNARIITGNKAVHIIYEVNTSKKTTTLDHIAVNAAGAFTKEFIMAWSTKYKYDLNKCVITGNAEFIVPAIRGNKIKFVRIKLE